MSPSQELTEFLKSDREFEEAFSGHPFPHAAMFDATMELATQAGIPLSSQPPVELAPSEKVGPYQLRRLLGAGGMGRVYEAEDSTETLVAVKVLSRSGRTPQSRYSDSNKRARSPAPSIIRDVYSCAEVDEDQGIRTSSWN